MRLRVAGLAAWLGVASLALVPMNWSLNSGDAVVMVNRWLVVAVSVAWLVAIVLMSAHQARFRRLASWLAAVIPCAGFALTPMVLLFAEGQTVLFVGVTILVAVVGVLVFALTALWIGAFSRTAMATLAGAIVLAAVATAFTIYQQGAAQTIANIGVLAFAVGWIPVGVDAYRRAGRASTAGDPGVPG